MPKKPPQDKRDAEAKSRKRGTRDYSQRAHDTVREVEKRHVERHADDEKPED